MTSYISGIQQCGIGVANAVEAALYYKSLLGFDCLVFDDTAEAGLMTRYTGNQVFKRRALLTMNMQGGAGIELWQYLNRTPVAAAEKPQLGDLGIFAIKIKTRDIRKAHQFFTERKAEKVFDIYTNIDSKNCFLLEDIYHNHFEILECDNFFSSTAHVCGGVYGAIIGVADIEKATSFYTEILQTATVISSKDLQEEMNRVLLKKEKSSIGAFANLLGDFQIELIQNSGSKKKIYQDRYWGDLGFMHLCLDVADMVAYKKLQSNLGNHFTVDSNGFFEMDQAGGRFCYIEDADNTLIELVETYKVPILKKWGWYLNLSKRKSKKPLSKWMIKMLGLNKVSEKISRKN